MTSKLAQLLKEAGFPQRKVANGTTYSPSLADLITQCGDRFWSLRRTPTGTWIATGRLTTQLSSVPYYESATYEEPHAAVAELFLSIKSFEKGQKGKEQMTA